MRSGSADRLRALQDEVLSRLQAGAILALRWLFGSPPRGWIRSWILVLGLAVVAGSSTAVADWVPGSEAVAGPALAGALVAGALALVRPLRWPLGLAAALAAGILDSLSMAGPSGLGSGLGAMLAGDFNHAQRALLFLLALLMWLTGAWPAYAVLRWRRALLGLVPAIAVVATNVLNFPLQQSGSTFALTALAVLLLLWTAYSGRTQEAQRRGLRLSSESRWDFWESGLVAGAALMLVSFVAPPLSTVDRTLDAQSGVIKAWSDIQLRLHHELPGGGGTGAFSTGFSDQVLLGHPLIRNSTVVMTYQVIGNRATSIYFRGLDLPATTAGAWRVDQAVHTSGLLPAGVVPPYAEVYQSQQSVTVKVQMQRPPTGDRSLYFYPGRLNTIDRSTYYEQRGVPLALNASGTAPAVSLPGLESIDRLTTLDNRPTTGAYSVTGDYSIASIDQLRSAGTDYPSWVQPYAQLGSWGTDGSYRPAAVETRVQRLAQQVTAGAKNPYDAAAAIESYLRTSFSYTLKPPVTPPGQDPLAFFLFDSKKGYCEYFATAMGDMLRSIGIPTRLVNGYGPGSWDPKSGRFVVRESDAHTWVEAYFPHYGWIPFEPTPDGVYFPVPRGQAACHVDSAICEGLLAAAGAASSVAPHHFDDSISTAESAQLHPVAAPRRLPFDPWRAGLLGLAFLLLAGLLVALRYLTPRSPGAAWRRARLLGRLAGVPGRPGETPLEFGRRLARAVPRAGADAARLASGFTVAAYGPPDLAGQGSEDVMAGWRGLRPVLLRETAARAAGRRPRR